MEKQEQVNTEPTLTLVKVGGYAHESEVDALRDFWDGKYFIVIGPAGHRRWGRSIHRGQIEDKTARILYLEQGNMCLVEKFCTVELPEDNTHRRGGCGFMTCLNCRDEPPTDGHGRCLRCGINHDNPNEAPDQQGDAAKKYTQHDLDRAAYYAADDAKSEGWRRGWRESYEAGQAVIAKAIAALQQQPEAVPADSTEVPF